MSDQVSAPALIAIDWGTSSFRAMLATADGIVLGTVANTSGILSVHDAQFAAVLQSAIQPWLSTQGDLPVVMSGMIGSRQGWCEAPYIACPAPLKDLAAAAIRLTPAMTGLPHVAIIPGVVSRDASGHPDVMRGEETQIFGALARLGIDAGTFVLPGTHAKWVTVAGGAITSFSTYMTGEVFAALKDHSILGRLMRDGGPPDATPSATGFERGLAAAAKAKGGPGALLRHIFSARTLGLFDELAPDEIGDYLSGLLIGSEICDAAAGTRSIVVIANEPLNARYATALRYFDITPVPAPADCAAAGLAALARMPGFAGAA